MQVSPNASAIETFACSNNFPPARLPCFASQKSHGFGAMPFSICHCGISVVIHFPLSNFNYPNHIHRYPVRTLPLSIP